MINPLQAFSAQKKQQRRIEIDKALLRYEARIGGELFGAIAPGGRREFFCLDRHAWVWHEEWIDDTGRKHAMTTRYDVRPHGIFKSQGGTAQQKIKGAELEHFQAAANLYARRIQADYTRLIQAA